MERTLAGRQDEIKERTIGAEVFGRSADFETSGDSIVRVNANEVRKRLAQYYRESTELDPVQISLPTGTYIPKFVFTAPPAEAEPAKARPLILQGNKPSRPKISIAIAIIGLAATGIWFMLEVRLPARAAIDRFWAPMLASKAAVIISLPTTNTAQIKPTARRSQEPAAPSDYLSLTPDKIQTLHNWHMSMPVVQATVLVSLALQRQGGTSMIRIGTDVKADELRGHPIVAIGSFSNPWAQRRADALRFTFDRGPSDTEPPRIRDSEQPHRSWALATVFPEPQSKDYAIVTRIFDPVTGEPIITLAGLHSFGCQTAADWVSSESDWKTFAAQAPPGWETMNLQVVLETDVINLTTTPPKVLDSYFWK